jgi:hypothetical protein
MKGKHQRARHQQLARATAAELERLRAEIAAEARHAAAARDGAEQARVARHRLTREQTATERQLRPQESTAGRVVRTAMQASAAITAARQELEAVERELSRFSDAAVREIRQAGVKMRFPDIHRSADERFVDAWYRKRTGTEFDSTRTISLFGWIPDDTPVDLPALAPFAKSTVLDTSPQACWAWAAPPWLRLSADTSDAPQLRAQLGTSTSGAPKIPREPYPGPPLRAQAVLTTPWRHAPWINEPADAIDLAYWYSRSAWAQQWRPGQIPVPFWLPAEHAAAYPQARALPPDTDLRLPYPTVFAALAAPWRIEPRAGELPATIAGAQLLMLHARGHPAKVAPANLATHLTRLKATDLNSRDDLPTPLEALDHFGGHVEGLLLTAADDGTPGDAFAWCIAIGHPSGFPIARVTIPASRAASTWRTQVDNTIAGIALSCWHEPLAPAGRALPAPDGEDPTAADTIRVLDIDATSPPAPRDASTELTRNTRPHLRRGHWRQQRVGQGRQDRRWTWVRPTTVNGGASAANQVYTLRPRAAGS